MSTGSGMTRLGRRWGAPPRGVLLTALRLYVLAPRAMGRPLRGARADRHRALRRRARAAGDVRFVAAAARRRALVVPGARRAGRPEHGLDVVADAVGAPASLGPRRGAPDGGMGHGRH